ncbi:helix-turn-helix domain-containing protein [Nocardioides sp. NPDC057772]|uniref:helix-turn-helix domain-containing protein n=1 Tax=Nocardioides sp. NPDC057772 TaxID=3346245 RepID=UPI00366C6C78
MTDDHRVTVHLDALLEERGMTLTQLADRIGITVANPSILESQPGDILRVS